MGLRDRIVQLFALWRDVIELLRRAAPKLSLIGITLAILEAIVGLFVLYAIKLLVDSVSSGFSEQSGTISAEVIAMLLITGSAIILAALLQSVANIVRMRQGLLVSDYVDGEIHERAISVGLRYYESPEYYDALERAREGGTRRPAQIAENSVVAFRAAITIIGIFFLMWSIEYRAIPILLIPIAIALFLRLHFARRLFDWRMSRAQTERRASYLDFVMTKALHAKDLRINGIGEFFRQQYSELRTQLRIGEIKIEQSRLWTDFSMAVLGAIIFITASAWLLYQSIDHGRPIGDVVLFVLLLRRAEGSGRELVGNISKVVDDHLYLRRLFEFLSVPIQSAETVEGVDVTQTISSGLELSNVSFRYDGASNNALDGVNLKLAPGQVVAVVGENGSGKTTLIKLLTRLYDPSDGVVTLDGLDVRKLAPQEFRKRLSVVFQDYAVYADTVANNIRFGDVDADATEERVETAAINAGASKFIDQLPLGYNTPLTKLFDNGHDLSIGQWQRLALARALYPHTDFLILDEPTSAMDAKAEFELFRNFRTRINGRGALIISHRLSTVRQADYIYVLKEGKIAEHGNHSDLIERRGIYFHLFEQQAHYYK